MRKRHWLSNLLSGVLWAALPAACWAQNPDAGFVPYVDPNTPQAANMAPAYQGYEAAGWPQGATQWPYISPYTAPPVDQTTYQNGFWFNEQRRDRRKYFTYLGATFNTYADPGDTVVGDARAPGFFTTPTNTGTTTTTTTTTTGQIVDVFARHRWSDVKDPLSGGGFSGIMGWMNPTDTGVFINGFWSEEGRSLFDAINPVGDPLRPESTLLAVAGVPLFDGRGSTELPITPPDTEAVIVNGGGTQPYDMMYRLQWQSGAYGAGVGLYGSSFYSTDTIKFRPVYGLRYLNLRENAVFEGMNSGLAYTVNGGTRRPEDDLGTAVLIPLESYLQSRTKSQMAGPELGLKFDLGGEKFRLSLQSKLGILANHSKRELAGYGIGRTFDQDFETTNFTPIPDNPNIPTAQNPTGTGFQSESTTTHVSPTFEQSIMFSAPLLQFVPGVRKVRVFEEANFNFGYTWLVAGSVYRPGDTIDWKGYPNFPEIKDERTTWFMSSWNFGVEWNY